MKEKAMSVFFSDQNSEKLKDPNDTTKIKGAGDTLSSTSYFSVRMSKP